MWYEEAHSILGYVLTPGMDGARATLVGLAAPPPQVLAHELLRPPRPPQRHQLHHRTRPLPAVAAGDRPPELVAFLLALSFSLFRLHLYARLRSWLRT